jgi:hypothetical protein
VTENLGRCNCRHRRHRLYLSAGQIWLQAQFPVIPVQPGGVNGRSINENNIKRCISPIHGSQRAFPIIGSDESHIVSVTAFQATKQAVNDCFLSLSSSAVLLIRACQILGMLDQGDRKEKAKRMTIAMEKLKLPFKQAKMELLRSNLDRLKASLTLMLEVLSYCK